MMTAEAAMAEQTTIRDGIIRCLLAGIAFDELAVVQIGLIRVLSKIL